MLRIFQDFWDVLQENPKSFAAQIKEFLDPFPVQEFLATLLEHDLQGNDLNAAEACANILHRVAPESLVALISLAKVHLDDEGFAKSVEFLELARKIDPKNEHVAYMSGLLSKLLAETKERKA